MALLGVKRKTTQTPALAGMLSWQYYLIAYVLGLLAWQEPLAALCAALLFLLLSDLTHWRRAVFFVLVMVAGAGIAVWCSPVAAPALDSAEIPAWMLDREKIDLHATVVSSEPRPEGRLRCILKDVRCFPPEQYNTPPVDLAGRLAFTWYAPEFTPPPGARIAAHLRVAPLRGMTNAGAWDYEGWWARQGVRWRAWANAAKGRVQIHGQAQTDAFWSPAWSVLWHWREALKARVAALLRPWDSQGRAAVFALLFGERSWLWPETAARLREAGVAHSFALSGLHIGFVVLVGFVLVRLVGVVAPGLYLKRPRQQWGALAGALLAVVYIWLGGWSPSLMRAALMFFIWGALYLQGRENTLFDGLLLAVAVMLVASPLLIFDLRLQLSALAVLGIAALLDLRRHWRKTRGKGSALLAGGRPIHEHGGKGGVFITVWQAACKTLPMVLLVSCSAQLALLPLIVHSFGELSGSFYLNVLWLPVLGVAVMPLSLAGLAASLLPWQQPAAALLHVAASISNAFLTLLQDMDASGLLLVATPMRDAWPAWVGYWCVLFLFWFFLRQALQRRALQREKPDVAEKLRPLRLKGKNLFAVLLGVVLLTLPAFGAAFKVLDRGVTLHMLDVGQGQALLLELPYGRRLLIDGGGFPYGSFDVGRAIVSPVQTAGRPPVLTGVVLSHHHTDHMLGLGYPLEQYDVGFYADNGRAIPLPAGKRLADALESKGVPHLVWQEGDVLPLGDGLALEVLHPEAVLHPEIALDPASELETEKDTVSNDNSLVLRVTWHGRGLVIMPGDIETSAITKLLESDADLSAQVLVLPHHGAHNGGESAFLRRVAPEIVLASAGFLNRYGFPAPQMRNVAAQMGVAMYVSSACGEVTVRWDPVREGALAPQPRVVWQRQGQR